MKPKLLVKISNIIGIISIILLVYWVFIFTITEVFGLRVFRQNMTETFYMSILGILALMAGALMINIMFNLTRIADKQNIDNTYSTKKVRRLGILFGLSFPLILIILFGGDYFTSKKKERMLVNSAESIITKNKIQIDSIANYSFEVQWLRVTESTLNILSETDKYFPNINVIVKDEIKGANVYLRYNTPSIYIDNDTIKSPKSRFILATTQEERDYLSDVFENKHKEYRFSSYNGNYELFYPYQNDSSKTVVFYFSDYQRYGKSGY